MKQLLLVFTLFCFLDLHSQTVSLERCIELTKENYPKIKQLNTNLEILDLKIESIKMLTRPKIDFNAQVSYQSDVTHITLPANSPFSVPVLSKDQYKVYAEINQIIYDGGVGKAQIHLEETNTQISQSSLAVEVYQLNERTIQLYFTVLALQETEYQLDLVKKDFDDRYKQAVVSMKNGVILESEVDKLAIEILKIEQQKIDASSGKNSAIQVLSEITGMKIEDFNTFSTPELKMTTQTRQRPEFQLYDYQKNRFVEQQNLNQLKYKPKIYAFGQGGYGKPGMNMLENKYDTYYIVGLRLNWNIWDWGNTARESKVNSLQINYIDQQRQTLEQNLNILEGKEKSNQIKIESLIEKDKQILELRKKIVTRAASQYENGIITPTEYAVEKFAYSMSELSLKMHQLQMLQSQYTIQYINGL